MHSRAISGFAYDRASVSSMRYDRDGRLHVDAARISKATVNPYYGHEIPGWQQLGLDGARIYQLLRSPDELRRSVQSFNNLPLLSQHVYADAQNHRPDAVVGATGSDAGFNDPYLMNSLVVWAADAIALIESGKQRELSCAYRYTPVMTPGTYQGERYDGVMRDLDGSHLALVAEGRAGPDCAIATDQALLDSYLARFPHGDRLKR